MEYNFEQLTKIFNLSAKYYSRKKIGHATRVAEYAAIRAEEIHLNSIRAYMIGLAHDLLEDTECPKEELIAAIGETNYNSVVLLTKSNDQEYEDYIRKIVESKDSYAFIVKQADMKDHMTLSNNLTEKLLNKYVPVLHYFL